MRGATEPSRTEKGVCPHFPAWFALIFATVLWADSTPVPGAPFYTAQSIANSASNVAGEYAPDTFLSIYGQNLSYITKAIGPGDITGLTLPTVLGNVRVLLNGIFADVYYVSPGLVNILIPPSFKPGPVTLVLMNDSLAGPSVPITVTATAPGLFQLDAVNVIATHGNGPLVTPASPAKPGEVVVLYATGLGPTSPPAVPNQLPTGVATVVDMSFQVLLNGVAVDPRAIQYAGVTPGYAGLFQINLLLPASAPANPEIRVGTPSAMSAAGKVLPLAVQ